MSRGHSESSALADPLRSVRRAVEAGRFRDATTELSSLRRGLGTTPEWLLLMAMATWRLGEFAESHQLAERARLAYRTLGDTDGEMRAQNVTAAGAFARGNLGDANRGFAHALHLARQHDDKLMMARCANNLGAVEFHRGNNAAALALYGYGATLFEQAGSLRGIAETWHNKGIVRREERDLVAACQATDRALEAAQRLGDDHLLGQMLCGKGETDAVTGDLRLGRANVERALDLARAHQNRLTECEALRVLAFITRKEGNLPEALGLGQDAVRFASELQNHWMEAKAHHELAQVNRAMENFTAAKKSYLASAEAFRRLGADKRGDAMARMAEDLRSD